MADINKPRYNKSLFDEEISQIFEGLDPNEYFSTGSFENRNSSQQSSENHRSEVDGRQTRDSSYPQELDNLSRSAEFKGGRDDFPDSPIRTPPDLDQDRAHSPSRSSSQSSRHDEFTNSRRDFEGMSSDPLVTYNSSPKPPESSSDPRIFQSGSGQQPRPTPPPVPDRKVGGFIESHVPPFSHHATKKKKHRPKRGKNEFEKRYGDYQQSSQTPHTPQPTAPPPSYTSLQQQGGMWRNTGDYRTDMTHHQQDQSQFYRPTSYQQSSGWSMQPHGNDPGSTLMAETIKQNIRSIGILTSDEEEKKKDAFSDYELLDWVLRFQKLAEDLPSQAYVMGVLKPKLSYYYQTMVEDNLQSSDWTSMNPDEVLQMLVDSLGRNAGERLMASYL